MDKKNHLCFEDFNKILLLQKFANWKISTCSLDWVCKILEFWSISRYFWSFKTFCIGSFLEFFSRSFTIAGSHIAIPIVNTNLRALDTLFYRSWVSLENYSPWYIFNKNPLFLSWKYIERSEAAIWLKNNLKNHPQPYGCWLDDNIYHF